MTVRLTIDLSDDVAESLKNLADKNGVSVTEQVRRAIATEMWIGEQPNVLVADANGNVKRVVPGS